MSSADWEGKLSLLADCLRQREEVVAVYLFGSVARGTEDHLSDVDLAVLLRVDMPKQQMWRLEDALAVEVSDILSTDEVDFFVINLAPLHAQFEIIATGRLLYSADENARTDFEVWVMNRYWDFEPYRRLFDSYLIQRIKKEFSDAERQQYLATLGQAG